MGGVARIPLAKPMIVWTKSCHESPSFVVKTCFLSSASPGFFILGNFFDKKKTIDGTSLKSYRCETVVTKKLLKEEVWRFTSFFVRKIHDDTNYLVDILCVASMKTLLFLLVGMIYRVVKGGVQGEDFPNIP